MVYIWILICATYVRRPSLLFLHRKILTKLPDPMLQVENPPMSVLPAKSATLSQILSILLISFPSFSLVSPTSFIVVLFSVLNVKLSLYIFFNKFIISLQSNSPDDIFENGMTSIEKRPLSFTFGDVPYEDGVPPANLDSSSATVSSNPEITTEHSARKSLNSILDSTSTNSSMNSTPESKDFKSQLEHTPVNENKTFSRAVSEGCQKLSGPGNDALFIDTSVPVSLLQDTDEVSELKPVELDTYEGNITKQLVKSLTSVEAPVIPERLQCEGSISGESEGYKSYLDGSIEEALQGLLLVLDPHKEQYKEFQELDQEVMHLDDILKVSTFSESTSLKKI